MAAAIVPIVTALAPDIIALITALVHKAAPAAEATLGPGTGPVKFAQVFQDVIVKLQQAAAAGQIDKTLPPDPTVQLIIQSVVTSLKLQGQLNGDPSPTPPPAPANQAKPILISAGQTITIQAA